jgi:outer membrane protein
MVRHITVLLAFSCAAHAQSLEPPPVKIGVIDWQKAIMSTVQGRQSAAALQARFEPRRAEVEKKRSDLNGLQGKLHQQAATLDETSRARMEREIDRGTRALNRLIEDLDLDLQEEQAATIRELGANMNAVIEKYIVRHRFAVILEVTGGQPPAAWAAASVNLTEEIVKAYDQAYPVTRGAR